MSTAKSSRSTVVRDRLSHPVIDSDGHVLEFGPVVEDYVRMVGGGDMAKLFLAARAYAPPTREGRAQTGGWTTPWWVPTANSLDYATGALPRLLYERLDDLGVDFGVLYPSVGLHRKAYVRNAELRQVVFRALNTYYADFYREFADRMTPVALIPMETPGEAIAELEYAVKTLGLKAALINGYAQRSYPWEDPEQTPADGFIMRPDVFAIGSEYDYDPFWAKCVELRVSPTSHSPSMGFGFRRSPNYMYNHIGHFAAAGEALCKALFFGGVTYRFPSLRIAFLECGVGWACNLYADLIARWEKRGGHAIGRLNPANLDKNLLLALTRQYGNDRILARIEEIEESLARPAPAPETLDDFAACGIAQAEDIKDRFVPNFYFGCEADDPINAWAFNAKVNPFGARLNAIFSSDISHWDVPDIADVLHEAFELVEHGLITPDDFRDFVFGNPVRFYAGANPDFFKGTRIEAQVAAALSASSNGKGE